MSKRSFVDEPTVEVTPDPNEQIFDFTTGVEVMQPLVREAYYRITHVALTRDDASLLPDGKIMTLAEVEIIIGSEVGDLKVARVCCS